MIASRNTLMLPSFPPDTCRLLLTGTPRSGNTWFRRLLADTLSLREIGVHHPDEVEVESLPSRCIIQLHWRWSPEFVAWQRKSGLRPVVISRNPLSVLVSILHFCRYEPDTLKWLAGEGGDELELRNTDPTSEGFLNYATGPRAAALLAPSVEWVRFGSPAVRYEDLVSGTELTFRNFLRNLGARPLAAVPEVIAANSLKSLRSTNSNYHYWQGNPNLWRMLLTPSVAAEIMRVHEDVFRTLGYSLEPVSDGPDPEQAKANWNRLVEHDRPRGAPVAR